MPELNIRQRRLETKIAYVGPDLVGALDWRPKTDATFRDCEVHAELIATDDVAAAVAMDADAIVFVASADAENAQLQLQKRQRPNTPIVVQVSGEAVEEAAQRALTLVLEGMRKADMTTTNGNGIAKHGPDAFGATPSLPREGNPLLSALRQVLRETVTGLVSDLETRLVGRFENLIMTQLCGIETTVLAQAETLSAMETLLKAQAQLFEEEQSKQRGELAAIRDRLAVVKRAIDGVQAETKTIEGSLEVLSTTTQKAQAPSLEPRLKEAITLQTRALIAAIEEAHTDNARGLGEARAAIDAVHETTNALIEELKKPKKSWFG